MNIANVLFYSINLFEKLFNIDIKQKYFFIYTIYFKNLKNNLYLLIFKFNRPNKSKKKHIKY